MTENEFEPEVTEEEWLNTPPGDMNAFWRSVPYRGRRRTLLTVALLREVADLLTDERCLNAIFVVEAQADGMVGWDEVTKADKEVDTIWDSVKQRSSAAYHAVAAVHKLFDSLSDASAITGLAFAHRAAARSTGDEHNEVAVLAGCQEFDILAATRIRDIFGNPFRPVAFDPSWRTDTAVSLAKGMYESRDFSAMPILADALQDADCDNDDILDHCRDANQVHVRGCWVVDLVLGKS